LSRIDEVHKWEQAVVTLLNFDTWELEWCGGGFEHYDAKGKTPKGIDCVIEMKFRNKYYEDKLLEKYKYDKLMSMDEDIVKIYFINDPKANYLFWLNSIALPEPVNMWCPDTTLWTKKKVMKPCYLLPEKLATYITKNEELF
tara:strand:- start:692 stop:1117 length:426 start_codon:yes stop_codon:yes gene_type:complete